MEKKNEPKFKKIKLEPTQKKKILKSLILLVVILFATNPALIPFLPQSVKQTLVDALSSLFGNVTEISSVIHIDWIVLFKLLVMIVTLYLLREICQVAVQALNPKTGRGQTLQNLSLSMFSYLFAIVGIFWALSLIGVNMSTLFASAGILALIVGFGAESLIADVVTGLFMIFENEYNVGDIIELDGYRGTITNIGIRTTALTDAGGNVKIFNNSDVRNIVNLSNRNSRAVCDFPIPYDVSLEKAEQALQEVLDEVAKTYADKLLEAPSYIGVQELGESAVVLRIMAQVREADRFTVGRILNRELKIGMEKRGISCPFNQLVVHSAR
jgi:small conductance mechanosensitive channel